MEMQRISRCRAAINVLDLAEDQSEQAAVLAFLSKALLVHPYRWDHTDAGFAFDRLTAAYMHHVHGTPWRHGFQDLEDPSTTGNGSFDTFERVVRSANEEEFPEPELLRSCLELLELRP